MLIPAGHVCDNDVGSDLADDGDGDGHDGGDDDDGGDQDLVLINCYPSPGLPRLGI